MHPELPVVSASLYVYEVLPICPYDQNNEPSEKKIFLRKKCAMRVQIVNQKLIHWRTDNTHNTHKLHVYIWLPH